MHKSTDTITSRDLPRLRRDMLDYAADEVFSDEFRTTCRTVIAAIDQACDDDERTHAALEDSLHTFVATGNNELKRSARIIELCHQLGDADETAEFRDALIALIPLLPRRHVLLVSGVIAEALQETGEPTIDFDLAALPVASDHLH